MRLLVVEGNTEDTWRKRQALGGVPYHKRFEIMLKILRPQTQVAFAFPAEKDSNLPTQADLTRFDGVLWTGSSLYVNDAQPAVHRQLTFAHDVFRSGVPFYGSCWGLQIAAVVAGGQVTTCKKGREFGITSPISLTEEGRKYPGFASRKGGFQALCIHLDEVSRLPENAIVLAGNDHSNIQAVTIRYKKSEFFGVQYHPEFMVSDLVFIARHMSATLIGEGLFGSVEDVEGFAKGLEQSHNLPETITDYLQHIQEIKCWLDMIESR